MIYIIIYGFVIAILFFQFGFLTKEYIVNKRQNELDLTIQKLTKIHKLRSKLK